MVISKHLSRDLQPYSCPFDGCNTSQILYIDTEELLQHLEECHSTARNFSCCLCGDSEIFDNAVALEDHLRELHSDDLLENDIQAIVDAPAPCKIDWPEQCPVCQITLAEYQPTTSLLREHLRGKHRGVVLDEDVEQIIELHRASENCPVCDTALNQVLPPSYSNHLFECLYEFALRALPWNDHLAPAPKQDVDKFSRTQQWIDESSESTRLHDRPGTPPPPGSIDEDNLDKLHELFPDIQMWDHSAKRPESSRPQSLTQGLPYRSSMSSLMMSNSRAVPIVSASPTVGLRTFPLSVTPDQVLSPGQSSPSSSESYMTTSLDSLAAKLTMLPRTIPESRNVDHSLDGAIDNTVSPLMSPNYKTNNPLSRNSSTRSLRATGRAARIPGLGFSSQGSSRRSGDPNQMSASPVHAFLSSWNNREATPEPAQIEPKPDDEGQAIGLNNEYIIGRTIARGEFGVVKEAHSFDPRTGENIIRAVKIVRKQSPGQDDDFGDKIQQELEHEVSVWRHLKHNHILSLHAVYEMDYATFCVMDLNVGGSLFDLVAKQRTLAADSGCSKGLDIVLARRYAYQLACALRYLHEDIRVCHRDVKLENCLVDTSGPNAATEGGNLRLCDFGLADFLRGGSMDDQISDQIEDESLARAHLRTTSSVIGTLEYASPKGLTVNRKLFETAGDIWAFGVVVYALCTGDLPFRHTMPSKTIELIMHAEWDGDALRQASAGSKAVIELVRGCLELDIDLRWTIGDVLRSPWFESCVEETDDRRSIWT